jgi:hypothetical protein
MSARTTIHFICDALEFAYAGPLQLNSNIWYLDSFFYSRISAVLTSEQAMFCDPKAWIIRANRMPARRNHLLQEGDEILIGGQHVEYLPWNLNINRHDMDWLRHCYFAEKQTVRSQQPQPLSRDFSELPNLGLRPARTVSRHGLTFYHPWESLAEETGTGL